MDNSTALLLIDVQNGQIERPVARADVMLANIAALLARARERNVAVLHVQHDGEPGERFAVGSHGWAIHPRVGPQEGEPVIRKRASDAFHGTALEAKLQERGIKRLIVAGCRTEYCVDTTCRRATSLGLDVVLVGDGHSTTDNAVLTAEQIIAHHNEVLEDFGNDEHVIRVVLTERLLAE